jgi:hypothetical protein
MKMEMLTLLLIVIYWNIYSFPTNIEEVGDTTYSNSNIEILTLSLNSNIEMLTVFLLILKYLNNDGFSNTQYWRYL